MNVQACLVFLVLIFFHVPISKAAQPDEFTYLEALGPAGAAQAAMRRMEKVRTFVSTKKTSVQKSVDRMMPTSVKTVVEKANSAMSKATMPGAKKAAPEAQDGASVKKGEDGFKPMAATTNAAKPSSAVAPATGPVPVFKPTTFAKFTTGVATGARAVGNLQSRVSNQVTQISRAVSNTRVGSGIATGVSAVANAHVNVNKQMANANTLVVKGLSTVGRATGVNKVLDAAGRVNEAGKQAMIKANTALVDHSLRAMGTVVAPVMNKLAGDPAANANKPVSRAERAMATLLKPKLHETNQQLAWRVKRAEAELAAAKKVGNWDRARLAQQKIHDAHSIANQRFMRSDEGGQMQVDGGLKSAATRKKERKALLKEAAAAGYQPAIKELQKMAAAKQNTRKRAEERHDAPTNALKASLGDVTVGLEGTKGLEQMHRDLMMDLKVAKERASQEEPRRYKQELITLARLERLEVHLAARKTAVHGLETAVKELRTPQDFVKLKKAILEDAIKDPAMPIKQREAYQQQLEKLAVSSEPAVVVAPKLDDDDDAMPKAPPVIEPAPVAEQPTVALKPHVGSMVREGYKPAITPGTVKRPRKPAKTAPRSPAGVQPSGDIV